MLPHKFMRLNVAVLVALSVALAEILTSGMSILLRGTITKDYLITGAVVSLIVSLIVIYFHLRVLRAEEDNENLRLEIERRRSAENRLRETEEKFRLFLEHTPIYVFMKDENIRAIHLSRNYETLLGRPIEEIVGKTMDELFPSELAKNMVEDDLRILREGKPIQVEEVFNGRTYSTLKFPIFIDGSPRLLAGFTMDITERRVMEAERERLIADLEKALAKVKTLSGLLPICSYCKKIRDDKGYWSQLELYIHDHSGAEFSHGICPECLKKHYPEESRKIRKNDGPQ